MDSTERGSLRKFVDNRINRREENTNLDKKDYMTFRTVRQFCTSSRSKKKSANLIKTTILWVRRLNCQIPNLLLPSLYQDDNFFIIPFSNYVGPELRYFHSGPLFSKLPKCCNENKIEILGLRLRRVVPIRVQKCVVSDDCVAAVTAVDSLAWIVSSAQWMKLCD